MRSCCTRGRSTEKVAVLVLGPASYGRDTLHASSTRRTCTLARNWLASELTSTLLAARTGGRRRRMVWKVRLYRVSELRENTLARLNSDEDPVLVVPISPGRVDGTPTARSAVSGPFAWALRLADDRSGYTIVGLERPFQSSSAPASASLLESGDQAPLSSDGPRSSVQSDRARQVSHVSVSSSRETDGASGPKAYPVTH